MFLFRKKKEGLRFLTGLALLAVMLLMNSLLPLKRVSAEDSAAVEMPTNEQMYITLAENSTLRWNVNDNGNKGSVVHLNNSGGNNRRFRLDHVTGDYYAIKHEMDNNIDRFVDVDGKSTSDGAVLHLWENSDDEVSGSGNHHRQFSFHPAGKDDAGNQRYYIKSRKSGLWLGVQDNKVERKVKIVQTSEENRKAWFVTPSVVPLTGSEAGNILKNGDAAGYCEFFETNSLSAINVANDGKMNGSSLHPYTHGTSSKWKIYWHEKYQAYEIERTESQVDEVGSDFVWDVDGQSGSDGTWIHLWQRGNQNRNKNTTRLWRFIKQSDGHYKIQNASSGLYAQVNLYDMVNEYLAISKSGSRFDISLFNGGSKDLSNHTNFAYADNWMKDIPDGAYLSSVNLPATHDTGTAHVDMDDVEQLSLSRCQDHYFGSQLNLGARSFDIRCNPTSGGNLSRVEIIHGFDYIECNERDGKELTLESILDDSVRFLKEHPSETIIHTIKADAGSDTNLARALGSFIGDKEKGKYVYKGGDIPSMGEARGKIVFLRRFEIKTEDYNPADDGLDIKWFGLDLTNWDDHSYNKYEYALEISNENQSPVYVQDAYNVTTSIKKKYIEGTFKQSSKRSNNHPIPNNAYIFNYTSSAVGFPLEITRDINPWIYKDSNHYFDGSRLGMVMLNYLNKPLSDLVYKTNFGKIVKSN